MQLINALLLAAPALATVHTVDVGETGLKFDPQTLSPKKGDIVIFSLYSPHDVAQGAFDKPCTPASGGFFSGTFDTTDSGKKKFVYNVTSEDPIYFYCSVPTHCESGMVGGFNVPSSGNTIQAFANAAKNGNTVRPSGGTTGGQLLEAEQISSLTASATASGGSPSPSASGSGSRSASAASTTPAASGSAQPSSTPSSTAAKVSSALADSIHVGPATGVLAGVLGFFAWLL